eukprot:PhM_4_TR18024/c1_g3_i5/m.93143
MHLTCSTFRPSQHSPLPDLSGALQAIQDGQVAATRSMSQSTEAVLSMVASQLKTVEALRDSAKPHEATQEELLHFLKQPAREQARAAKGCYDTHEDSLAEDGCPLDPELRAACPRLRIPLHCAAQ